MSRPRYCRIGFGMHNPLQALKRPHVHGCGTQPCSSLQISMLLHMFAGLPALAAWMIDHVFGRNDGSTGNSCCDDCVQPERVAGIGLARTHSSVVVTVSCQERGTPTVGQRSASARRCSGSWLARERAASCVGRRCEARPVGINRALAGQLPRVTPDRASGGSAGVETALANCGRSGPPWRGTVRPPCPRSYRAAAASRANIG